MRTIPSAFGRSSFSRRDDSGVFASFRENDDKRMGSGEADTDIALFGFDGFEPRDDFAPEYAGRFVEADTVLAFVALCFFMIPLKTREVEFERLPACCHRSPCILCD